MDLTIHRGTAQIGGTVITVRTENACIALDAGTSLEGDSPEDTQRLSAILWQARDGIFLTHAHPDHSGLAMDKNLRSPVFMTEETQKILLASSLLGNGMSVSKDLVRKLPLGRPICVGDLSVTAFEVDHSVAGAVALLVEGDGVRLLYTGDLRMHGLHQTYSEKLCRALAGRVDVLLMEGTNLDSQRPDVVKSEMDVHSEIAAAVGAARGLVLAHCSPQNVDRLLGFINAARTSRRIFVADVYSAFVLYLLKRCLPDHPDLHNPPPYYRTWLNKASEARAERVWKGAGKFMPLVESAQVRLTDVLADPGRYVLLFRPSMLSMDFGGKLPKDTTLVYSAWRGYLSEEPWKTSWVPVLDHLGDANVRHIHTSGHINRSDWVSFVDRIRPGTIIPVHTNKPEAYAEAFPRVRRLEDGEVFSIPQRSKDN
jgi:ribonuclease J